MTHTLESRVAKLFSMTDEVWARHANPWSVWTRFTVLPLLIAAIWSRVVIGYWAWLPVALLIFWTWLNPRLFSRPTSTDNWTSKAVLGERVWLNRKVVPVPIHHRLAPNLLSVFAGCGMPFLIWGLWQLHLWPTIIGLILVYTGKVWFLDRMVWLYDEMQNATPEYKSWLYHEK